MREICWLVGVPLASQEVVCSMELGIGNKHKNLIQDKRKTQNISYDLEDEVGDYRNVSP